MALEIISSTKGKTVLIDNGNYLFNYIDKAETKTLGWRMYWRCHTDNCGATLITNLEHELQQRGRKPHNHDGEPLQVQRLRLLHQMKRRAADTVESTTHIVTTIRSTVPEPLLIALPSTDALFQRIQKQRRRDRGITDDDTINFQIPPHLRIYEKTNDQFEHENVPFLLYDSFDDDMDDDENSDDETENGGDELRLNETAEQEGEEQQQQQQNGRKPRIIILGSEEGLLLLRRSARWYGDGTFDISPTAFNQVFTLHAAYDETKTTIPCLYVLLERKTKATFIRMFQKVRLLVGMNIRPQHYLCDFEKAQMNAFHAVYPGVSITGCNFHLADSVRRKGVSLGLQTMIAENWQINMHVKYIRAMAFVPTDDIPVVWQQLAPTLNRNLRPLAQYFESTYIGTGATNPQFHPERWSVYQRCLDNDAKCNNSVEAYHGGLSKFFGVSHPTPLMFISKMKSYHGKVLADLTLLRVGKNPRQKQRPQWKENDLNKRRIAQTYQTQPNKIQYIKDIAATFI